MIYREFEIDGAPAKLYVLSNTDQIDADRKRPLIVICPGGAYRHTSEREAEAVAVRFMALGYNALTLYYTCSSGPEPLYPRPQEQLACAMRWVRENCEEINTDPSKVVIMGFSAGGHLAASFGVYWRRFGGEAVRPDAMVLCYPVITSGPYAHRGSIENLLGQDADASMLEMASLEKNVTCDCPPAFIWTTRTDQAVPYQNSVMFSEALSACNVKNELKIYEEGPHGLSLGTEEVTGARHHEVVKCVQDWPERADRFLTEVFGKKF